MQVNPVLEELLFALQYRQSQRNEILVTLADITTALQAEETVEAGVITLLQTLSADLTAANANNDQAGIQAVIDKINTDAAAMAAAVAVNTPASTSTSTTSPPADAPVSDAPAPADAPSTDATQAIGDQAPTDEATDDSPSSVDPASIPLNKPPRT